MKFRFYGGPMDGDVIDLEHYVPDITIPLEPAEIQSFEDWINGDITELPVDGMARYELDEVVDIEHGVGEAYVFVGNDKQ